MALRKDLSRPSSLSADGLLVAVYLIDGAVAASGVSVMVLQGKEVSFPGALHLFLFQLCYIVPQLITTPLAERLCATASARNLLLPVMMLTSLLSSYLVLRSLSTHSLALFFAARVVSGFFRHPKVLFPIARAEEGSSVAKPVLVDDVNQLALPAMHAGFIVSAVLGDVLKDAVAVQRAFVHAEVFAVVATCALAVLAPSPTKALVRKPTKLSAATRSRRTLSAMMLSFPDAGALVAWGLLTTFAALRVAAGVNQCVYPLVGPSSFGVPYTICALHLVGQDYLLRHVAALVGARQHHPLMGVGGAVLLLLGVWAAPVVITRGPFLYYPMTFLFIDVPTAVLHALLTARGTPLAGCPEAIQEGLYGGLLAYTAVGAKLMSAPLRLAFVAMLPGWKYPSHLVAIPAASLVAVSVATRRLSLGVAAACAATAAVLAANTE